MSGYGGGDEADRVSGYRDGAGGAEDAGGGVGIAGGRRSGMAARGWDRVGGP